jgi:hypothetical protein
MPSIKGALVVTNKDWKYVYNSILNFVNEEVDNAYNKAVAFYNHVKEEKHTKSFAVENFNDLIANQTPSTYQKMLIKSALFSGTNDYIYAPKKNNFKKFTNRTSYIDTGSIVIEINKKSCSVYLTTGVFVDFDKYIIENTFLSEFINMVNTIPWPTRNGPSKATRGCRLLTFEENQATIFYKSGPRPPELSTELVVKDITVSEPNHLASKMIKAIKYVSSETSIETAQPIPTSVNNNFDDC